jgi:hypothetical protein
MGMKYYIDEQGNYLGGFDEDQEAIEVSEPPADARMKYVNGVWTVPQDLASMLIKQQIDDIEREQIMPRKTREIQIQIMLYFAQQQGLTHEQLYAVNPAYKGMVDIDNQIKALRELL